MERVKKEQIYSDTVEEIISNEFPAFLRYGIVLIFILFALLFSILGLVKYPESVQTEFTLTKIDSSASVNSQVIYSEIHLTEKETNKIKIGQEITLKLNAFPFQKFELLKGKLEDINDNFTPASLLLKIRLTDSFTQQQFKREMSGHIDISTKDVSIIQKFSN